VTNTGDMYEPATSSYDPIFYMHHAFVDYLYAEWQSMIQEYALEEALAEQVTRNG
jgi:hypothetical protein